jgi:hypothetical protein
MGKIQKINITGMIVNYWVDNYITLATGGIYLMILLDRLSFLIDQFVIVNNFLWFFNMDYLTRECVNLLYFLLHSLLNFLEFLSTFFLGVNLINLSEDSITLLFFILLFILLFLPNYSFERGGHDTQHNDTQHNHK